MEAALLVLLRAMYLASKAASSNARLPPNPFAGLSECAASPINVLFHKNLGTMTDTPFFSIALRHEKGAQVIRGNGKKEKYKRGRAREKK
jgi:hypothetical protein